MREWESQLAVAEFDPTPYVDVAARVAAQGIVIQTIAELATDPERDRKLHALDDALGRDVPAPEPPTTVPYENFVARTLQHPNLLPDAYFIALHDGEYVGMSNLWANGVDPTMLYTGLTGVRRAYRRRGIALALKLRAIAYAQAPALPPSRPRTNRTTRPCSPSTSAWASRVYPPGSSSPGPMCCPPERSGCKEKCAMEYQIRPFTPDDYPAFCAVWNAVYTDFPQTTEEWRFDDEHRDPKCKWARWVAETNGRLVAGGHYDQSPRHYHPQKFYIDIGVLPELQGRGLGKAIYTQIMAALSSFDPLVVRAFAREDTARSLRFLADPASKRRCANGSRISL